VKAKERTETSLWSGLPKFVQIPIFLR